MNDIEGDILQPPFGRGAFDFDRAYTDVPNQNNGTIPALADFLLTPIASTVGGPDFVGGADWFPRPVSPAPMTTAGTSPAILRIPTK